MILVDSCVVIDVLENHRNLTEERKN